MAWVRTHRLHQIIDDLIAFIPAKNKFIPKLGATVFLDDVFELDSNLSCTYNR